MQTAIEAVCIMIGAYDFDENEDPGAFMYRRRAQWLSQRVLVEDLKAFVVLVWSIKAPGPSCSSKS